MGDDHPASFTAYNASAHNLAFQMPNQNLLRNQEILRLPPYSSMLSMVEKAISAFKAELRRTLEEARSRLLEMTHDERMASLAQFAEMVVTTVTHEKCNHTQGYLPAVKKIRYRKILARILASILLVNY